MTTDFDYVLRDWMPFDSLDSEDQEFIHLRIAHYESVREELCAIMANGSFNYVRVYHLIHCIIG